MSQDSSVVSAVDKKKTPILGDFTTLALVLIPVGIGINYVGSLINKVLQLPFFLDSIGTIITGVIAGPWVGAVVGLIQNLIFGMTIDPTYIPYAIVNVAFGLAAGFMARADWFEKWYKVIWAGLVIIAIAVLLSAPIQVFFFGGVPEHAGAALLWGYLRAIGRGVWEAVFAVSILRELGDKLLTVFLAFFIYKSLPVRFLVRFPGYFKNAK